MNKYFKEKLEKAFFANNTWYPEKKDKDGDMHPETSNRVKHTAFNKKPVWKYDDQTASAHEQALVSNYSKFKQKNNLSDHGHTLLTGLLQSVIKDPDRHVIGSGTSNHPDRHFAELRLRHLSSALAGHQGYGIKESPQGLHITAPRHSKSNNQTNTQSNWVWDGNKVDNELKKSENTPISNVTTRSSQDVNQRAATNSGRQSRPSLGNGSQPVGRPKPNRNGRRPRQQDDLGFNKTLKKGSRQKKIPFNPNSYPKEDSEYIEGWASGYNLDEGREDLPRLTDPNARERVFQKLHSQAESRINPTTKEREFLLYRGYTHQDFNQGLARISSFTPSSRVAYNFNEDATYDIRTLSTEDSNEGSQLHQHLSNIENLTDLKKFRTAIGNELGRDPLNKSNNKILKGEING